jgi:hypothetical protein
MVCLSDDLVFTWVVMSLGSCLYIESMARAPGVRLQGGTSLLDVNQEILSFHRAFLFIPGV